MKLIVGLGNPGPEYEHTRHNIGFDVVKGLANRQSVALKKGFLLPSRCVKTRCGDEAAMLLMPTTFMNRSGHAVWKAMRRWKIKIQDLIVIVDHNKIQSSQYVKDVINLGNLKKKFQSFGWYVKRCNGHSFKDIDKNLKNFVRNKNKPRLLIADTIKGKGVSFMEHPNVMKKNKLYNWHAGAPDDESFYMAQDILLKKLNMIAKGLNIKISYLPIKLTKTISKDIH